MVDFYFLLLTGLVGRPDKVPCFYASFSISSPSDPKDPYKVTEETRSLGLVVCRGTAVVLVCPADSMESIPNPFLQQETN